MIPIVIVCGPTASGKTSLAIEIAKRLNGEIISADSMQIYKGMDIATAKPDLDERDGITHYMFDIKEVTDDFSVSEFCDMAHTIAKDITDRGKLPIVCGGTGLYIDSMINDIDFSKSNNSDDIRAELQKIADREGSVKLHEMLNELDSVSAQNIHPNNVKRVIRAIEHIKVTGEKFSEYKENAAKRKSRYNPVWLMIDVDREILYERINRRVDIMKKNGLIEEAKRFYDMSLPMTLTSMSGIGYKELFKYFDGKITLDAALDEIKQSSRHYAKRQLTWFRRNKDIIKLEYGKDTVDDAVNVVIKNLYNNN